MTTGNALNLSTSNPLPVSLGGTGSSSGGAVLMTPAGNQTITGGFDLIMAGGNFQAGNSGNAGALYSYPPGATSGNIKISAQDNATGDFGITITNAGAFAQNQTYTIPDVGVAAANFIMSQFNGTQHIETGGLQLDEGPLSVGLSAGGANGSIYIYPNPSNGYLALEAIQNATGDFNTTIRNAAAVAQDQVVTIPDVGTTAANFIMSASAGVQGISSGSLQVDNGNLTVAGGGVFIAYPPTPASGQFIVEATDNTTGNFNTVISNAGAIGQLQQISVPDSGTSAANFILSQNAGTQTIGTGNVALSAGNLSAVNMIGGYTTTATAAGTTVLTVASTFLQYFTGATTQTVTLPVTSTLLVGQPYLIVNNSTGAVTVNSSGGNLVATIAASTYAHVICILTSGTSAASWSVLTDSSSGSGTVNAGTSGQLAYYASSTNAVSGSSVISQSGSNVTVLGNIFAGNSGNAGYLASFPAAATSGHLSLQAVTNASGDFNTIISNDSAIGQSQTITIPDSGTTAADFLLTQNAGTQTIATGGLQITSGSLNVGENGSGNIGQINIYPATINSGTLSLVATDNGAGNSTTYISNASSVGQGQTITIPDSGAANANFILSATSSNQEIVTGSLYVTGPNGDMQVGKNNSGNTNKFVAYPAGNNLGSTSIYATNNSGNYANIITNAATSAARTWTFPDLTGTVSIESNGTFTPSITFGGLTTGITYSVQQGYYTRTPGCLFFSIYILLSNKGSATGAAAIQGLPVAARASGSTYYFSNLAISGGSSLPSGIYGVTISSGDGILMEGQDGTGAVTLVETNFTNTSGINCTGFILI